MPSEMDNDVRGAQTAPQAWAGQQSRRTTQTPRIPHRGARGPGRYVPRGQHARSPRPLARVAPATRRLLNSTTHTSRGTARGGRAVTKRGCPESVAFLASRVLISWSCHASGTSRLVAALSQFFLSVVLLEDPENSVAKVSSSDGGWGKSPDSSSEVSSSASSVSFPSAWGWDGPAVGGTRSDFLSEMSPSAGCPSAGASLHERRGGPDWATSLINQGSNNRRCDP
ncbi:hypothetical protein JB92DRAFT_2827756 [Gautieria morchelliformis]|nr:hypothetical protein JB92DRAFT_2827756 [Gautieria morchelliformis]